MVQAALRLQLTAVPMAMMALAVCVASAASSQNTRVSAASGSCCWLDSTACPLPTHSCEIPACSYKLDADDSVAGLAAGTTCFTCHAERCSQATAPAGSCYTGDDLVCDPTRDPSICAATPHSTLHPGIWQMDCISFCHCQGYQGCAGDVGYELAAPPPPPQHSFSNGDVFEGELVGGKMHGRGVYRYAGGNVYTGHFHNGRPHGPNAVFEYANGDRYEGPYLLHTRLCRRNIYIDIYIRMCERERERERERETDRQTHTHTHTHRCIASRLPGAGMWTA